jgi:DNA uptake protein ComE-like DNA-binding protein
MATKIRINLASERELLELPGMGTAGAAAVVRYRAEHGPIKDATQLASILRGHPNVDDLKHRVDYAPAAPTAPEAPGA